MKRTLLILESCFLVFSWKAFCSRESFNHFSSSQNNDIASSLDMLPNFCWINEEKNIGAMAGPYKELHIEILKKANIGTIITLTEESLDENLVQIDITYIHIPIRDFECPKPEQIAQAIAAIEVAQSEGKAIVVNCLTGTGRTGTIIACWLVKKEGLSAEAAVNKVRALRPYSVETIEQFLSVVAYEKFLKTTLKRNECEEKKSKKAD